MLSISSLALPCGCEHTIFASRVAEYSSPDGLSASTTPSVYRTRTSPWRRVIVSLLYSELGSRPSTGLQGVHSDRGYDARADLTQLSTIQREAGALAQIAKIRV